MAPALHAQSTHGAVVGTVADPSKAVAPGVSITLTNTSTNIARTVATNQTGYYEAAFLLPGTYRLEARLSGFTTFVRETVIVESRSTVRVDIQLSHEPVSETVEVVAVKPVIETETPQIADGRTAAQMQLLPSSGATEVFAMMFTLPGVQSNSIFTYSFNGARSAQTEFMIDGISSPRSTTPLGGTSNNFEMVSELKIHTGNNNAEFGSPGVISVVTKSGTNRFKGAFFYYHGNSALNARDFFAPEKTKTKQHTYGGTLSGPLVVPGLYDGHDKTFFAASYWSNHIPGQDLDVSNVPTLAMRQGDFSRVASPIIDPTTGVQFPGNVIPAIRLSPIAVRVQDRFYPVPNYGDPNSISGNFRANNDRKNYTNRFEVRLDQKISDKNLLYARYSWRGGPQQPLENLTTIGLRNGYRRGSTGILSDTHTFNDKVVNEFRLGFQRSPNQVIGPLKGQEVLAFTGIQGLSPGGDPDWGGMPSFSITGLDTVGSVLHDIGVSQVFQATDTLIWIKGRHSFKTGFDLQRNQNNDEISLPNNYFGGFTFSGFFTGNAYADFLLGLPERSNRATYRGPAFRRQNSVAFYAQDDWRVAPKLTLSYGARYEYQFAAYDRDLLMYNIDPATASLIVPDATLGSKNINPLLPATVKIVGASAAGFPQKLRHPDANNIVPRLGVAFRPSENWVLRGGYGIFVDSFGTAVGASGGSPLFGYNEEFRNTNKSRPTFVFPNPFGAAGAIGTITGSGFDKDLKNAFIHQWNVTVERALGDLGIRASYIGTQSKNLSYRYDLNLPAPSTTPFNNNRRPYPQFGSLTFARNGGHSIYHGLQLDVEKRMSKGLYLEAAWTWGKALSNVVDDRSDLGPVVDDPSNLDRDYGREQYSVDHRLNGVLIWEVPVGKGRRFGSRLPAVLDHVLGGWTVSALSYWETGRYFAPSYSGVDPSGTGRTSGRPDRIGDGNLPGGDRTIDHWFDAAAFEVPKANIGRFGNAGRGILEGPGLNVQHLSLAKKFELGGERDVQVQLNAFNVFNHPNFDLPAVNISSPGTVGKITAMRIYQEAGSARTVNLELRLNF
jgi:hypothetical protein